MAKVAAAASELRAPRRILQGGAAFLAKLVAGNARLQGGGQHGEQTRFRACLWQMLAILRAGDKVEAKAVALKHHRLRPPNGLPGRGHARC